MEVDGETDIPFRERQKKSTLYLNAFQFLFCWAVMNGQLPSLISHDRNRPMKNDVILCRIPERILCILINMSSWCFQCLSVVAGRLGITDSTIRLYKM